MQASANARCQLHAYLAHAVLPPSSVHNDDYGMHFHCIHSQLGAEPIAIATLVAGSGRLRC